jgi:TctA family transporter
MSHAWAQAFAMVFDPYNIFVMLAASLFGLFVGAVPGLTATMATALLVPVTFFMAPVPRSPRSSPQPRWRSFPATSRVA